MELRQLRYLLAVAETSNFTRAAEQLFVTQSALSQQIQALEQEVGTILLDRSKRGTRLTSAGEILTRHAVRALHELEQASIALRELDGLQRGEIRVGAVQTVNTYFVPSLVSAFTVQYPDVRLEIEELPADDVEAGLESGDLQVGISFAPPSLSGIGFAPLFEEQLALAVRRDHPLAREKAVSVAQLDGMPLIMLAKTFCTRRLWETSAKLASAQPKIVMEMNTVSGILSVVAKTGIATVLPRLVLSDATDLIGIPLRDPTPSRQVSILWDEGSYLCAASRAFISSAQMLASSFM
jgi:LysR family transcriptional regulator, cyn operon transcriptional activator